MRDVDVVHGDPEQARRDFAHQAPRDVDAEFVGARQRERVRFEIVDAQLQQIAKLLQLEFVAAELRRVKRRFVVVAQKDGCNRRCRTSRR